MNDLQATVPNNLTVRSISFTAAAPTKMKARIRVKEVDVAVAGTAHTLKCSRDDGAAWATMALTKLYQAAGLYYVEAPETDVSVRPAGTSPRWLLETHNNKMVELDDIKIYWS